MPRYDRRMNVSASPQPTSAVQPPLPGLDIGLATYATIWTSGPDKIAHEVPDPTVDGRVYASFDEAVTGAREILVPERRDARWGLFKTKPGPVAAIALLERGDGGIRLARTDALVDPFHRTLKGSMFWGQSDWGPYLEHAQRMDTSTLALVGAERLVDLRSGERVRMPRVLS